MKCMAINLFKPIYLTIIPVLLATIPQTFLAIFWCVDGNRNLAEFVGGVQVAKVPVILANARLSARSARGYDRLAALVCPAFGLWRCRRPNG